MGHEGYVNSVNSGFATERKREAGSLREKEHLWKVSPKGPGLLRGQWDGEFDGNGACP